MLTVGLLTGAAVLATSTTAAGAPPGAQPTTPRPSSGVEPTALPADAVAMPLEMFQLREALHARFGGSPNYGISQISPDKRDITFRWHGPLPAAASKLIADATRHHTFTATIESTNYRLSDLLAEADRLMDEYGGSLITGIGPKPDGSGLDATVSAASTGEMRAAGALSADTLGIETTFPLDVAVGETETAAGTRLSSTAPHYVGSRIQRPIPGTNLVTSCTTSWLVGKPTGERAMLTASHCGATGMLWSSPGTRVNFGTVTQEHNPTDSAVITANTLSGSQFTNSVYTGAYNSSQAVGYAYKATITSEGDSVCYSGSYSGLTCGSLVTHPLWTWEYDDAPGLGEVRGMRTYEPPVNNYDTYGAVGNGDSGGPGFLPVYGDGGAVYVAALSIIGGMEDGLDIPQACQGVPGGGGRACSKTALATYADEAARSMGWTL